MRFLFLFAALSLLFTSCQHDPLDVDVSSVNSKELQVQRLEKDLMNLNSSNIAVQTGMLQHKYGNWYEHYLMNFLNRGGSHDSLYAKAVLAFTRDHDIRDAYASIQKLYPDQKVEALAREADDCVKRFHYHFPKRALPVRFVTVMSGWNYSSAYADSSLVVSLDMYLGDTSHLYRMLRLPQYQTKNMNEHYILPDLARGWLLTEFDNSEAVNTLLHHTVFYGKLYYAMEALLPDEQDSVLIGYSSKQMNYCSSYEKKLWGYFAEKNRLYENNLQTVRELTSEGPFTGAISKDCPPRIAMWIGWQIVRSYMKNNKDATLESLMNEKDAAKILNKSKYRP